MKTYIIILSKVFPYYHIRKGEPTNFKDAFNAGQVFNRGSECGYRYPKLHTIRSNYELWKKRIEEVQRGEAQLSIRQWSGKPYHSKQELLANLTKDDGVGIQRLITIGCATIHPKYADETSVDSNTLSKNDGLSKVDWVNWFDKYDLTEPLAIIHFTRFRYGKVR